jgi:uncharacterized protein with beta-barrel porin domain
MFTIVFKRICIIYLFIFSTIYSQSLDIVVNEGEVVEIPNPPITSMTRLGSLTNYGTVILSSGNVAFNGTTINNGTIEFRTNNLNVMQGSSNGNNSLVGNVQIVLSGVHNVNSPVIFTINGENTNITGGSVNIGANRMLVLNSAQGVGDLGYISFGSNTNSHLILDIDGNQTFNKGLRATSFTANVNKTGSGDLYFNTSLAGVKIGSILAVNEGSVYLNLNASANRFATIAENNGTVYFDLTSNSTLASYIGGDGTIIQRGGYSLNVTESSLGFNGNYHIKEGDLILKGKEYISPVLLNGNIIAYSGSSVGGWADLGMGNLTLKGGSSLFAGDNSRSFGNDIAAQNIFFEDNSRYEVYADNETSGSLLAYNTFSIGDNVSLRISASPDNSSYWKRNTFYAIIKAGMLEGAFDNVSTDLLFLDPYVIYSNNGALLRLRRNDMTFGDIVLTPNQAAAAEAIEGISMYDADNIIVDRIYGTATTSNAPYLFDILSGEFYASSIAVQQQNANEIKNIILNRMSFANNTEYEDWISIYAKEYKNQKSGYHDIKSDSYGFMAGFDSLDNDNYLIGLSLGFEKTNSEVSTLKSEGDMNSFYISLYGSKKFESFELKGGAIGGVSKIKADREIKEFDERLNAKYDSYSVQLFAEANKEFEISDIFSISPYLGLSHLDIKNEGFSESKGESALGIKSVSQRSDYLSLGVRSEYEIRDNIAIKGSFGVERAFQETIKNTQNFLVSKDEFSITGTPAAKTAAKIGLGAVFNPYPNLLLSGSYEGVFAKDVKEQSLYLKFGYGF